MITTDYSVLTGDEASDDADVNDDDETQSLSADRTDLQASGGCIWNKKRSWMKGGIGGIEIFKNRGGKKFCGGVVI